MEGMNALITCVIWSLKETLLGEECGGGLEFIGFSKVRVGERGEKVLCQHKGLLFCWVRQYRRLSCQPRGDPIDLGLEKCGGYTPCCFNLFARSNLV